MNHPPIVSKRSACPHCNKNTRWHFATALAPAEACEVCNGMGTVTSRELTIYYRNKQKPVFIIPPYRAGSYKGMNPDDIPF